MADAAVNTLKPVRTGVFRVASARHSYLSLLYMLISGATGTVYFLLASICIPIVNFYIVRDVYWKLTGQYEWRQFFEFFSPTPFSDVIIASVPLMLFGLAILRPLAHVESLIVRFLLGAEVTRSGDASRIATVSAYVRLILDDLRTWSSLLYMLLMGPLGIIYFTIAVTGIALSLGLALGSIWSLITGHSQVQISDVPWLEHLFRTAPGLVLLLIAGVLLFFVVLHIARGIGWLHGRIAELLLVRL